MDAEGVDTGALGVIGPKRIEQHIAFRQFRRCRRCSVRMVSAVSIPCSPFFGQRS